jgi:putative glutamine amidotransferase
MGSLVSDLKPYRVRTSNNGTLLPRKKITIKRDSMLHHWLDSDSVRVNSLHHQAINVVGKGLRVSSRDADGIIQSIESTGSTPRLGVQWHPEYMPQRREQRRLFESFVAACRRESCDSSECGAAVCESLT